MKKKIFLIILASGLLCITGCGGESQDNGDSENTVTAPEGLTYKVIEDSDGNVYEGYVNAEGLYEGYGVMQYADSTLYEGTWEAGVWEGSAEITWNSGCIYVGETHAGAMHGIGYMIWPMGDYYIGEWENGNPNGAGTKYFMIDSTAENTQTKYNIYTGDMENGLKVGHGVMRYTSGALYDGEWINDVRSGHGVVYWESGLEWIKFEGEFANDWISGEGTMYYADGRVVKGVFEGTELIEEISE